MFRKLLTSTALVAVMTAGAYAQETQQPMDEHSMDGKSVFSSEAPSAPMTSENGYYTSMQGQILASTIIGKTVYNGTGENAESVGDVNDIVLSQDGTAEAVVIGVGGFLGIAEKNVAIDFEEVRWLQQNDETWLVVATTKEQLEAAPEYEARMDKSADAGTDVYKDGQNTAATGEKSDGAMIGQDTAMAPAPAEQQGDTVKEEVSKLNAPAMTRDDAAAEDPDRPEAMTFADSGLSAEELIGTTVYGSGEEAVGEVGDVIVDADDKVEAFVIEVGGFLGFGEKPVAVDPSKLKIMKNGNGELAVHTDLTETELKEQLAFTKEAWDTNRDSVLVR